MICCTGSSDINNYGDQAISNNWIQKYRDHNTKAVKKNVLKIKRPHKLQAIHFTGGGYINDFWPHLQILNKAVEIKKQYGTRLVLTGISLHPLVRHKTDILNLLENFDYIDCRDGYTKDILSNLSVEQSYSGDDIFVHSLPSTRAKGKIPSVVVNLQQDLFDGKQVIFNVIDSLISYMELEGISNICFAQCMSTDYVPSFQLQKILRENRLTFTVMDSTEVIQAGFPIGELLISTRYHPHLVSYFSGCKGIAFAPSHYYQNKHNLVTEMGSDWPVCLTVAAEDFSVYARVSNQKKRKEIREQELEKLVNKKQKVVDCVLKKINA